jgi:hypothetical protein
VTDLSRDETLWREIPSLDGINLLDPKGSATVLVESSDGNSYPILTVGPYGKGRVMTLASDYAWKWDTGMVSQGKGNGFYLRLMERIVRWLTNDPGLESVQITLPDKRGKVGEEMSVRIIVRGEYPVVGSDRLSSASGGLTSVSILDPDGVRMESEMKSSKQRGEYLASFIPRKRGIYRLRVETPKGHAEESMIIGTSMETLDAFPNHEQLRLITASTGGKMLRTGDEVLNEMEDYAKKYDKRFIEEKRLPIRENLYILTAILFLLAMEWYLRRRWGLI